MNELKSLWCLHLLSTCWSWRSHLKSYMSISNWAHVWQKSKGTEFCIWCGFACSLPPICSTCAGALWTKLDPLHISSFNWAALVWLPFIPLLLSCQHQAAVKMEREGGSHVSQLCSSGHDLWEMELLLFKALCGFCLFIGRWEEVDLKLCQVSCCLFSLPIPEWSGQ